MYRAQLCPLCVREDGGKPSSDLKPATSAMCKLVPLRGKIPHNSSPAKSAPQEVARLVIKQTRPAWRAR